MPQMSRGKKSTTAKDTGDIYLGAGARGSFGGLDRPPTLTAPAMYEN